MMTDFQAVDLDAVLDEFEFSQELQQAPPANHKEKLETTTTSSSQNESKTENPESPEEMEDLSQVENVVKQSLVEPIKEPIEHKHDDDDDDVGEQTVLDLLEDDGTGEANNVEEPEEQEQVVSNVEEVSSSLLNLSSISSGQPDVLSGVENVIEHEDENDTLSQHLDSASSITPAGDVEEESSGSSDQSTGQSSEFESIYDKYRDRDEDSGAEMDQGSSRQAMQDDFQAQNQSISDNRDSRDGRDNPPMHAEEQAKTGVDHTKMCPEPIQVPADSSGVKFEPSDVTNSELDNMLAELEVEQGASAASEKNPSSTCSSLMEQVSSIPSMVSSSPREMGARPKDNSPFYANNNNSSSSSSYVSASSNPTNNNIEDNDTSSSSPVPSSGNTNEIPDIVMGTSGDNTSKVSGGSAIPTDSPPPYSEIDPMKMKKQDHIVAPPPARPTSLDIVNEESGAQKPEPEVAIRPETEVASRPETEAAEPEVEVEVEAQEEAVVGPPGSTPANPNGPANSRVPELLQGLYEDQLMLGKVGPFWIPDTDADSCMLCDSKFTLMRRRHHCRACGQVLCSLCCGEKAPLDYLEGKENRVCKPCKGILERLAKAEQLAAAERVTSADNSSANNGRPPNPSNPMEYCSTIPPLQQVAELGGAASNQPPPSVMVPVGVLKHSGGDNSSSSADAAARGGRTTDPKQVIFSDGIRPGGDLTELDGSPEGRRVPRRSGSRSSGGGGGQSSRKSGRRSHSGSSSNGGVAGPVGASDVARSMIPNEGLPYVSGLGPADPIELAQRFKAGSSVPFTLNRNLRVYVSLVTYSPVAKYVWNFKTQGMSAVGQDEVVILVVQSEDELIPPRDIFEHFQFLYEQAGRGGHVGEMGYSVVLSGGSFLNGHDYGGFLYLRHSFQCVDGLDLPKPPFLFGVLLTKWEMPWARVFPLRLLLRLGAESRYYPCPLWSTRERQTVYKEIGNTIMKLLSDFRNFTYSLPIIRGMVIHMEDKLTTVLIPQNSYPQIQKALQNSNDPVLALGANFSPSADSHLVAVQREEDEPSRNALNNSDYETQAINIQNKARKVTGASFIVLNGALKSSAGLTAKSSIVEDGIMVQVSADRMLAIRKGLNNMEDTRIFCGPIGAEQPDETVLIKWVDASHTVNAGIKSVIDGTPMDGVTSVRMHAAGTDYMSGDHLIRWTEVFLLPTKPGGDHQINEDHLSEPEDPAKTAGFLARAVCLALTPHLKKLKEAYLSPLAVRVNLDPENACYEAGSKGSALPPEFMNSMDNELVPIIHGQSSSRSAFEFIFHILDL